MRNLSIIVIFTIILLSNVFGQSFSVGIEVGGSVTNLAYEKKIEYWDVNHRYSFNGLIFVQRKIYTNLFFQTGFRYVELGSNIEYEDYVDIGVETMHLKGHNEFIQSYLSLPLKIKYAFSEIPIFIYTGPEVGYLINAKYKLNQESPDPEKREKNISSKLENINISLNLGLGVNFNLASNKFYISSQYSLGITGIAKKDKWYSDWTTQEISINLGYYLPF